MNIAELVMEVTPHQIDDPPPDFSGRESDLAELHAAIKQGSTRIGIFGMGGVGKTTLAQRLALDLFPQYPSQIYLPLMGTHVNPLSQSEAMMIVIDALEQNYRVNPATESSNRGEEDVISIRRQLNDAQENLRLIEERKAEYVFITEIPLQLKKDEGRLRARIDELQKRLVSAASISLSKTVLELQGQYRSILRTNRVLLLADDAEDAKQVAPLIPPSNCLFLVTSRDHLDVPGLHPHVLHEFSKKSAKAFLLTMANRIGDQAEVIAERCGHLPLALRFAGSLLKNQLDLSPKQYAEQLREESTRLAALGREDTAVEATIRLSYNRLRDKDTERVFRQLAVFPASFDKQAEASICVDQANFHIQRLFRQYSLVDWQETSQRYRFHDLIRIFAKTLLDKSEDSDRLQSIHAEYYEAVLRRTNTQYLQGGNLAKKGLKLLGLEWANIRTGQDWAATRAQKNEQDTSAARLCSGYAEGGKDCIAFRLLVREQARWHESGLVSARRVGNLATEATHLGALGCIYAALGEPRKAINYHEQHLALARAIGDRKGEGDALGNLGNAYVDLDQIDKAIEFFRQQRVLAKDLKDSYKEYITWTNLAGAYALSGGYDRALSILYEQLKIAREFMDIQGESIISMNLGLIYFKLGDFGKALKFYREALHLAHEIEDRCNEANAWWNMSLCAEKQGFRDRAIGYAKEALKLFIQLDDSHAWEVQETLDVWE